MSAADVIFSRISADMHANENNANWEHRFSSCDGLGPDLVSLYRSHTRSDVTLIVQSREFKAHRLILSTRSKYFAELFNAYPCRSIIEIEEVFDLDTFDRILEFIYGGKIPVNAASDMKDVIKLERLAQRMHLDLGKVFQAKKKWLENADQPFVLLSNVISALKRAFAQKNEAKTTKCIELIEEKFDGLYAHPEMLRLPFEILLAFISRKDRPIRFEDKKTFYLFCWYSAQKEAGVEEIILTRQMRQLFKHIRLEYVEFKKKADVLRPMDWVSAEDLFQSHEEQIRLFNTFM